MNGHPGRHLLLGLALAATLLASWWSARQNGTEEAPTVAAVRHRTSGGPAALPPPMLLPDAPVARTAPPTAKDLFAQKSWYVPPPPPPPGPAAPPPPPPLPFSYLGKLIDGKSVVVFVSSGDRNYALHEGDVVEGGFKIEKIEPPTMTIVYQPMKHRYTLDIGRAN